MKSSDPPSPGSNRPSLARTSISVSTTESPRNREESDIRGDLAAGWGHVGGNVAPATQVQLPVHEWGWKLNSQAVRPLPPFYPLDSRSTRKLLLASDLKTPSHQQETDLKSPPLGKEFHSIEAISNRISNACQRLSIQVDWDNESPCATLLTMEMVEMVISIYLGGDEGGMMLGEKQTGTQLSIWLNYVSVHDVS